MICSKFSRVGEKRAYRKVNIDENEYTVHTLRHTCATLLYRSGVDIKKIQELLGHVQIDTTEIYTHLNDIEVKEVMNKHPLAYFKMEDALSMIFENVPKNFKHKP